MMKGSVNENFEAIISVAVKNGVSFKSINAVIDTGFTGFLSLPSAIILELGLKLSRLPLGAAMPTAGCASGRLRQRQRQRAILGDGSETVFDVYNAEIVWNGQLREIEIDAAETEPLLGMALLRGYRLQVDTIAKRCLKQVEGGLVSIETLLNLS